MLINNRKKLIYLPLIKCNVLKLTRNYSIPDKIYNEIIETKIKNKNVFPHNIRNIIYFIKMSMLFVEHLCLKFYFSLFPYMQSRL